ncbi:MAG: EF-P beta-lysylation protein EpmB [Cellvibrionaceae bacterium]|nr:EF-P beta-lysylation protein EpmB [Cellvibrionaceae bacterium]
MIPRTENRWQGESPLSWQQQLQAAVSDPAQLLRQLQLDSRLLPAARSASALFPLRVPQAFIARMQVGNPKDPLLRQVLPLKEELIHSDGYSRDPVGEQGNAQKGLIQKYAGRVLLLVNGHCAVNCRYCFRRHFPYQDNKLSRQQWQAVCEQIGADSSIREVIYSGGDPLASSDRQLQWLTQQIAAIPHIQRLRIHSRLPVVIPDRITPACLQWLTEHRLRTVFVVHINHPQEIDKPLRAALKRLSATGITLLNQAVLLKGVNDDVATLETLSNQLFEAGVLPYYLHLFDRVSGAWHFDSTQAQAKQLYRALQARLPGYLVPKLVKEVAGEVSKTPV